jgi:hypothetical protein
MYIKPRIPSKDKIIRTNMIASAAGLIALTMFEKATEECN